MSDSVIPDTKHDFFSRKNSSSALQHTFETLCLVESGHAMFSYVCYGMQAYGGAFFFFGWIQLLWKVASCFPSSSFCKDTERV